MRTFIVTGGNSGIGFEAARALAAAGKVVLAVRDVSRGDDARRRLLAERPEATVEVAQVDLSDLDSVRSFAARVDLVDVLVNNAGVAFVPRQLTREGVTVQFGANFLGHFLLTRLLLPKLERGQDPRVVTVSSSLGRKGQVDLSNLDGARGYSATTAYTQSKLANTLFAAELDRRLRAAGSPVKSVLAHPGVAATQMQQGATGPLGVVLRLVSALYARSPVSGARPTVEAALAPQVQGGEVYGPGRGERGPPVRELAWPSMLDVAHAAAVWGRAEALVGAEQP